MNLHTRTPIPDRKSAIAAVPQRQGWRFPVPGRSAPLMAPVLFAVIAGIDGLGTSIAFAALIFAGPLAAGFGMGVGVILLSSIVMALWIALRSRYPSSIGQVQEASIAILATAIAASAAHLEFAPQEVKVATAFAILGSSAVVTGLVFWIFGLCRFGRLVRFMPYPVVAGFLAGSGWLLIQGAVMMVVGDRAIVDLLVRPDGQQALAGVALMEKHRQLQFDGQGQLLLQGFFLQGPWGKVAIEVQPAFTHGTGAGVLEQVVQGAWAVGRPAAGVMGMNTCRGE